jgi:tetratricopeptide (TPR) repeat protein
MKKKLIKAVILIFIVMPLVSCFADKVDQEREAGKEYYRQADYAKAIKHFSEAIKQDPDRWKLYYYRGMAYQGYNQIDSAIIDFSKALELIPKIEKWYSKLPHDEWADIYLFRGILYHQKSRYESAISDFNQALKLYPETKGAYYYRGMSQEKLNKYREAMEDYTRVIDMMSKFMSGVSDEKKRMIYLSRANLYRKMNQLDLALADNHEALKIEDAWEAFLSRGTTLAKMERFDEAINDFSKAIQMNPSAETAYLYRASSRLLNDCDLNKILEDYYSLIDINNIDDDKLQQGYNQIAWILATAEDDKIRDGEKALKFAQKSINIDRNFVNLDTLAVTYAECGEYEQAIDIVKQAIALCKVNTPELLPSIEKHLESFLLKKPIRENCPGKNTELEQLRKWQSGSISEQ